MKNPQANMTFPQTTTIRIPMFYAYYGSMNHDLYIKIVDEDGLNRPDITLLNEYGEVMGCGSVPNGVFHNGDDVFEYIQRLRDDVYSE